MSDNESKNEPTLDWLIGRLAEIRERAPGNTIIYIGKEKLWYVITQYMLSGEVQIVLDTRSGVNQCQNH